jgi:hypothetical protein
LECSAATLSIAEANNGISNKEWNSSKKVDCDTRAGKISKNSLKTSNYHKRINFQTKNKKYTQQVLSETRQLISVTVENMQWKHLYSPTNIPLEKVDMKLTQTMNKKLTLLFMQNANVSNDTAGADLPMQHPLLAR